MDRFPYQSKRGNTRLPEKVRQVVETLPYGQIGVYVLRDNQEEVLRIGYSTDLRHRIAHYFRSGAAGWPSQVDSVEVILTDSEKTARSLEKQLISRHRPPHNVHHNPTDPIRQQSIKARRDQILDAATNVFAEKGFHQATTKDIAIAAGISEGTIYNYFDSKDELLTGIMTRLAELEHLDAELIKAMRGEPRDFLLVLFRHRLELIQQNYETLRAVLPEVLVNPVLHECFHRQFVRPTSVLLEQYLQARIELGRMRPVDVSLVARVVQEMSVGLLILSILGDEPLRSNWEDMPEVLATVIFDGLRPREGE